MLECSWVAKEGSPTSTWRNVSLLVAPRAHHGLCSFEGKLIAAGGQNEATVECFTLPSIGNEMGQWSRLWTLHRENAFTGVVPFGEALLYVGKCAICVQRSSVISSGFLTELYVKQGSSCRLIAVMKYWTQLLYHKLAKTTLLITVVVYIF